MKFTKLSSALVLSTTVLAGLAAPVATFAATPNDDPDLNGGVALPQKDVTDAAISFGDNSDNGNSGYLRLQMVPHVLDFGNHAKFDPAHASFNATGANLGIAGNNTHASYDQADNNKTELLSTKDSALNKNGNLTGTTWATVVDKQTANPALAATKANTAGQWQLKVATDGQGLTAANNQKAISKATLVFANTRYGRTADILGLTNQKQDAGFTPVDAGTDVADITKTVGLNLNQASEKTVAKADVNQGEGANVFAWDPSDVRLILDGTSGIDSAEYHTALTWTLSSTL